MGFLRPYEDRVYALLRMVAGLLFLMHGVQKLMAGGAPPQMPAGLFWTAATIETLGGALVLIGFKAAFAAFLSSGTMAFAYFIGHQLPHLQQSGFSLPALFPIVNKGELAALYCFLFLFIAARGAGPWSVDAARGDA